MRLYIILFFKKWHPQWLIISHLILPFVFIIYVHLESFFDSLPNIEEIREIFFDNKLYSNNANEIINTGDISDPNNQREGEDQESEGGASSDSFRSDEDTPECEHVTNPDAPACTCAHVEAGGDYKISTHHSRCHECKLPGANITCDNCFCLFHRECLPAYCSYHEDFSS